MMKTALIGLGMVGSAYADALLQLSDVLTLRGVFARSPEQRAQFLSEHGFSARSYDSIAEIADDPELDFVILATPPNARHELVETFATAGKHILMEKPVERNAAAATRICQICEAANVKLGIMLQHRMRPSARDLTEVIAAGGLGRLLSVEISVPWWRPQAYYDEPGRGTYARDGGGVLISQAIHTLDLALSFTGPVAEVTAMTATTGFHKMEAEDFATAGIRFANGAFGTLFATTASFPGRSEYIVLNYENASAHLEGNILTLSWLDGETQSFGETAATGAGADPMAFTADWHRDMIRDFADAITEDRAPKVPGREALNVHKLIEMIEKSGREGRRISGEGE